METGWSEGMVCNYEVKAWQLVILMRKTFGRRAFKAPGNSYRRIENCWRRRPHKDSDVGNSTIIDQRGVLSCHWKLLEVSNEDGRWWKSGKKSSRLKVASTERYISDTKDDEEYRNKREKPEWLRKEWSLWWLNYQCELFQYEMHKWNNRECNWEHRRSLNNKHVHVNKNNGGSRVTIVTRSAEGKERQEHSSCKLDCKRRETEI